MVKYDYETDSYFLSFAKEPDFYDESADDNIELLVQERPWKDKPYYFKKVRFRVSKNKFVQVVVSAPALMKMLGHAESGGKIEIMGLLQGKIRGDAFLITDCFRLPVEGTETRVNAGEVANEFMIRFTEINELTRFSNDQVVGWYHSHPGYGCWLSGIDVTTQSLYQSHQDPFIALVIDPMRSKSNGRVEIGAFRTFPEGFTPSSSSAQASSSVPSDKIQDFGIHCDRYYPLEVEFHQSKTDELVLDMINDNNWAQVLGSSTWMQSRKMFVRDMQKALANAREDKEGDFKCFSRKVEKCCNRYLHQASTESLRSYILNGCKGRGSK